MSVPICRIEWIKIIFSGIVFKELSALGRCFPQYYYKNMFLELFFCYVLAFSYLLGFVLLSSSLLDSSYPLPDSGYYEVPSLLYHPLITQQFSQKIHTPILKIQSYLVHLPHIHAKNNAQQHPSKNRFF